MEEEVGIMIDETEETETMAEEMMDIAAVDEMDIAAVDEMMDIVAVVEEIITVIQMVTQAVHLSNTTNQA